jgi:hypothetical protein
MTAVVKFTRGDEVYVKSTGAPLEVLHQEGSNVLTRRANGGGQWTYDAEELAPIHGQSCNI